MHRLQPTKSVLGIARRLEAAGFEAWCVGGAIRDALLGGHPLDWDIATTATPKAVIDLFGRRRTIPVGIEFGTVSVLDDAGIAHEITTFRRDVTTDGRHAEVEFGVSLDDDLARRDFTINAIAFRPSTGELRDPFGGRADLAAKVVRAVGDPGQRMREDRLRALRAIRFAARYDFAIDPATRAAIDASAPFLTRLSAERVQQELVKTMEQVDRPGAALRIWRDAGAFAALVPALAAIDDVALTTLDELPRDRAPGRVTQRTLNRLAALFLDVPAVDTRRALQALRVSRQQTGWVTALGEGWHRVGDEMRTSLMSGAPRDDQVRRWIALLGRSHAGPVLRVAAARWRAERAGGRAAPTDLAVRQLHRRMRRSLYRDPIELAQLRVDGDDLRRLGIPAGPIYAKILQALLELVLDDPARNTPETLLAEVPRIAAAAAGDQATPVAHPSTEQ
ncbi:MAG TPA: CCA tRNA nucleotidyltransferase [Gemmatimonadaceae bacterium]|nr:CCA tRNA nucleotidyltransferase [Gemmatimonadaceae bacterium]